MRSLVAWPLIIWLARTQQSSPGPMYVNLFPQVVVFSRWRKNKAARRSVATLMSHMLWYPVSIPLPPPLFTLLEGQIPKEIGSLPLLESLLLGHNKLSGEQDVFIQGLATSVPTKRKANPKEVGDGVQTWCQHDKTDIRIIRVNDRLPDASAKSGCSATHRCPLFSQKAIACWTLSSCV